MWFIDLQKALQVLEPIINPYMITIKSVLPAYDGIVFKMSNDTTYKYWYETEKITQMGDWRERFRA